MLGFVIIGFVVFGFVVSQKKTKKKRDVVISQNSRG